MLVRPGGNPPPSIRVRVSDPQLTRPLEESLREADCLVRRMGAATLDVRVAGAPAAEAWTELSFFLAAWAGSRPERLRIVVV